MGFWTVCRGNASAGSLAVSRHHFRPILRMSGVARKAVHSRSSRRSREQSAREPPKRRNQRTPCCQPGRHPSPSATSRNEAAHLRLTRESVKGGDYDQSSVDHAARMIAAHRRSSADRTFISKCTREQTRKQPKKTHNSPVDATVE